MVSGIDIPESNLGKMHYRPTWYHTVCSFEGKIFSKNQVSAVAWSSLTCPEPKWTRQLNIKYIWWFQVQLKTFAVKEGGGRPRISNVPRTGTLRCHPAPPQAVSQKAGGAVEPPGRRGATNHMIGWRPLRWRTCGSFLLNVCALRSGAARRCVSHMQVSLSFHKYT